MTSPVDYQAVLADLVARRAKLDAAIEAIREMMPSGSEVGDGEEEATPTEASPINPSPARSRSAGSALLNDTFFGLSTPEAVRKYLAMMKRPQRVADISKALLDGGQIHARDATTAYNNAYAALKRMRQAGDAVRIKSGEWGLAEWYTNKPKADGE